MSDDDGVCVVPRESVESVSVKSVERTANEEDKRARLKAGEISLDIYDMRRPLADAGLEYVDSLEDLED